MVEYLAGGLTRWVWALAPATQSYRNHVGLATGNTSSPDLVLASRFMSASIC